MKRVKAIRMDREDEVPDAILHEVREMVNKMWRPMADCVNGHHPSIVLAAINRLYAAVIRQLITREGLTEAAVGEAIRMVRNIEVFADIKIFGEE